jgi:hypothetical protein
VKVIAVPVAALAMAAPPPTYVHFDGDWPSPSVQATGDPGCGLALNTRSPGSDNHFLQTLCQPTLTLRFAEPQASVELFAKSIDGTPKLTATAHAGPVDVSASLADASAWQPLVLAAPGGAATITSVDVSAPGHDIGIDDLAISTVPQPDTTLTATPAASTTDTGAAFSLGSNVPATTYSCSLDSGPFGACTPLAGLALGAHAFAAAAVDGYGAVDPTPATFAWTVVAPTPPDADHDGIPDNQETLPLADKPAQVGAQTLATLDSGTVTVALPGQKQQGLQGIARLPVGTVVDASKGVVTVAVASNGYAATDRRHRDAKVTLSQGIFEIRQARMRKGVTKVVQIPVEFVLASPAAASAKCRRAPAKGKLRRPSKGIVRRLRAKGVGVFRVTGGASRADARTATFTTTDRCDGTLTRVTKGHAKVTRNKRGHAIVVRQGRRYFAKARLFIAKKGRGRA